MIEVVMDFDEFLMKTFIKNNDRGFYKFCMKTFIKNMEIEFGNRIWN